MTQTKQITLKVGDDEIGAWHFEPKGERIGGLVVAQEIFGVTEHIRQVCADFAEEGYEVIAPCLFDRLEKNFEGDITPEKIQHALKLAKKTGVENTPTDIQACIGLLKPPVFLTGFCYGGAVAWLAAGRCRGLAAVSGYYGRLIIDYVDETPKAPTILHFGETDESIPMSDVRQIEAAHPDMKVYVYPAGHGFNSDRAQHYDAECAALARERTLAHFQAHMP